jgi:hypothetical protein
LSLRAESLASELGELMRRCYHCRLQMVYHDDDGRCCLACGRNQDAQLRVTIEPEPSMPLKPGYSYTCEHCGTVRVVDRPSWVRRFCSRSCRTTYQMARQRQQKRWHELQIA